MSIQTQTNMDLRDNINELKVQRKTLESQLVEIGQHSAWFQAQLHQPLQVHEPIAPSPAPLHAVNTRSEKILIDPP